MQKISFRLNNNTNPFFGSDKKEASTPIKSNQPVKDEVVFNTKVDGHKHGKNKRSNLPNLLAIFAVIGVGVAMAVSAAKKGHNPIKKSYFDSEFKGSSNLHSSKSKRSGRGGGFSSRSSADSSYRSSYDETRYSTKDFSDGIDDAAKGRQRLFSKFETEFNHSMNKMSLEDLKTSITNKIPQVTNFDNPSEIVMSQFLKNSNFEDEKLVFNMYSFIKKQANNISNPAEALRTEQCGVYLLSKMHEATLFDCKCETALCLKKMDFLEDKIGQEVNALVSKHFNQNISSDIKDEIVKKIKYNGAGQLPYQLFLNSMNSVAETMLSIIASKHVVNGKMTPLGEIFFVNAERLNSKAIKINNAMQATDDLMALRLGSVERTINNYRFGKFESGKNEFWDEYFNKKWHNSDYKSNNSGKGSHENYDNKQNYSRNYTSNDVNNESLKIFKELGEDLGDINSLKKDELKKAFRRLLMKYHPDKCNEANATEITQKIIRAHEALSNACMS